MNESLYKSELAPIGPVAIKLGQRNVYAPGHDTWGVVTCEACQATFALGPNRIYGSRTGEIDCVGELQTLLAEDHKFGREHGDSYELRG
jgi:hypothetical protein